ncbi:hypothetical protein R9X47_16395 [Wukongibacter baidiensis]|uniref:hypothetical protein n=1 Tax=Wukongibacter baidiensis TaxID=1723361 RepID=UPI003D7FAFC2
MKKILKTILTLTIVFSLLCTPVFAETASIKIRDISSAVGEDYLGEFTDFIEEIEDIEKDDEKDLKKLFKQIVDLEEKLQGKWQKIEDILSKYLDNDELQDIFDEVNPENGTDEENQDDEGTLIISYSVKNGKTTPQEEPDLEEKEHVKLQKDTKNHKEIWELIKDIVPSKYLKIITHFQINTDGKEGTLAHVTMTEEGDNSKWMISVDMVDGIKNDGKLNEKELTDTIIHEFGHILTLNSDEIDAREPKDNESTFVTMEGVTKKESYLNQFYQKFWKEIYDEWEEIEEIEDDDEYYDAQEEFYEKYKARFVSDYAATNPGEDIAETFMHFVTEKKPRGKTIADKKVLFLYSFPELVKMREEIREAM